MKFMLLLLVAINIAVAHRIYQQRIPNGGSVPSPCGTGSTWEAVGHLNPVSGHHGWNQFGLDFKHISHKEWNRELCQTDSDGDGKTNGAELGDPSCVWVPGATPAGPATGHPGFCEPVTDPACQASSPC